MSTPTAAEISDRLRAAMDEATDLLREIEAQRRRPALAAERAERLTDELGRIEGDRAALSEQLVEAEHQVSRLMSLYVATYQLHATLDPEEVQTTIAEIAVDLLGADRFAIVLKGAAGVWDVTFTRHIETGPFAGATYPAGDPLLDRTLADGVLRLGPTEKSPLVAAVPFRIEDMTVGALVIEKLVDHRSVPLSDDRDLLDLLAAHAATAIFAARAYAAAARKLRTLESLVSLIRQE